LILIEWLSPLNPQIILILFLHPLEGMSLGTWFSKEFYFGNLDHHKELGIVVISLYCGDGNV